MTEERGCSGTPRAGRPGRLVALLALVGAVTLGFAGCEAETRENLPRPPIPTTVSVFVAEGEVLVTPRRISVPGARPININQNADAQLGQAPEIEDATVDFRIANQIGRPVALVIEGPAERQVRLPGTGTTSFQMALPTGIYRLASPAARESARLSVGPSRVSSGTSVLTP
jgi:hypothetical protein